MKNKSNHIMVAFTDQISGSEILKHYKKSAEVDGVKLRVSHISSSSGVRRFKINAKSDRGYFLAGGYTVRLMDRIDATLKPETPRGFWVALKNRLKNSFGNGGNLVKQ